MRSSVDPPAAVESGALRSRAVGPCLLGAIPRLRRTLVAPCTTTIRGLASEVVVEPGDDPVPLRSVVNLDSVESVSTSVLVERLGRLGGERMREVCAALAVATDCRGWASGRAAQPSLPRTRGRTA